MKEKIKVPKLFDFDDAFMGPSNVYNPFHLRPQDEDRVIFEVSRDGNWIEILGHRIDGFNSFEGFIEYLKHIVEVEEENKLLKADRACLIEYLETKIEESVFMRTRDVVTGEEFLSTQETVYRDILSKVKGE